MEKHWTERSIDDFLFRIAADFIAQLEEKMESQGITQDMLAELLNITKGRVSQIFNNPGNLTLKNVIKYAKTLGMKVSIVAYEDSDPSNDKGPINSDVFRICWENSGKPRDFWSVQEVCENRQIVSSGSSGSYWSINSNYLHGSIIKTAKPVPGEIQTYNVNN